VGSEPPEVLVLGETSFGARMKRDADQAKLDGRYFVL